MNLPALWTYGAGITTGLLVRWTYRPEEGFWRNLMVFSVISCIWPLLALLMLYDWHKGRPMPWSKEA